LIAYTNKEIGFYGVRNNAQAGHIVLSNGAEKRAGNSPMSTLERGFKLPEVMLALTFGSLLALAAAKTYPLLCQQSVAVGQHYRLELLLRQMAFAMEKDLRRAVQSAQGGRC